MKRDRYIEDEGLKDKRRNLRSWLTRAEYILWQELRREKLGYKFRRQCSIGPFIPDFYCHQLKLIIEVDGFVHDSQKYYDEQRDRWLRTRGYTVVRFSNDDVIFNRDWVLFEIQTLCARLSQGQR